MNLIHIADTHLGRAAFNKIAEDGSNLRETLIYENFLSAIECIIQGRPDVIVHAGDLFDTVKPKTRAYTTVLQALEWLQEAGIPLIIIAGNHSMQKTTAAISPFEVIDRTTMIHAAYRYKYERVEIGDTVFHLIPNMLRAEDYATARKEVQLSKDHNNVLVTHGLADSIKDRRLSTAAEFELNSKILSEDFDYIALGHYHGQEQVAPNAWYSGSIEHLTYGEIDQMKGGILVDPARRDAEIFPLVCTLMEDLGVVNCRDQSMECICEDIEFRARNSIGYEAMLLVTLDFGDQPIRLPPAEALKEIRDDVLDLKIRVRSQETAAAAAPQQDLHVINYVEEFAPFLQHRPMSALQREAVARIGTETLKAVMADHAEVTAE